MEITTSKTEVEPVGIAEALTSNRRSGATATHVEKEVGVLLLLY